MGTALASIAADELESDSRPVQLEVGVRGGINLPRTQVHRIGDLGPATHQQVAIGVGDDLELETATPAALTASTAGFCATGGSESIGSTSGPIAWPTPGRNSTYGAAEANHFGSGRRPREPQSAGPSRGCGSVLDDLGGLGIPRRSRVRTHRLGDIRHGLASLSSDQSRAPASATTALAAP